MPLSPSAPWINSALALSSMVSVVFSFSRMEAQSSQTRFAMSILKSSRCRGALSRPSS